VEKVRLPKKVAIAMKNFQNQFGKLEMYVIQNYVGSEISQGDAATIVYWMSKSDENYLAYYAALVNGYEVEQTPEDRVRDLFDYFDQPDVAFSGKDVQNKIARMFCFLNIKIEGVNA
jgi:hypothetical protein